jgi:hypothetical protein
VLATGRDPASSPGLQKLAEKYADKLITTSLEASDPNSVVKWAAELKDSGRIPHVDVSDMLCCQERLLLSVCANCNLMMVPRRPVERYQSCGSWALSSMPSSYTNCRGISYHAASRCSRHVAARQ